MNTTPANITRPATGPSTNSSLRFETPFILPSPSALLRGLPAVAVAGAGGLVGGGRTGVARLPIALRALARRRRSPICLREGSASCNAGINPNPFVMTSKICPSVYFRIFSWWKVAVGTLPRWNRIPLPSPRASWHGWQ